METSYSTSFTHYRAQWHTLMEIYKRLLSVLEPLHAQTFQSQLQKLRQDITTEALTILVAGGAGEGKSMAIQALLSHKDYLNAQVQFYEISWGEGAGAALRFRPFESDAGSALANIPVAPDTSFQSENEYERDAAAYGPRFSEMSSGSVEILSGVGPHDQDWCKEEEAIGVLPDADAVLFVLACDVLPSREKLLEIDRIKRISSTPVFFLCNRFDRVEPFSQAMVRRRFETRLDALSPHVFFTNAKGALLGQQRRDAAQLKQSEFPLLEEALYRFLVEKCGREHLLHTIARLKGTAWNGLHMLHIQEHLRQVKAGVLREEGARLHERLKQLEETQRHLVFLCLLAHRSLRINVGAAVANFYIDSADMIESWTREYRASKPLSAWDTFAGTARERLLKEIATFLTEKIRIRFAVWAQTTLLPLIAERLQQLEQEIDEYKDLVTDEIHQIWSEVVGEGSKLYNMNTPATGGERSQTERETSHKKDDWMVQSRQMIRKAPAQIIALIYKRVCFTWHAIVMIDRLEEIEELQALIENGASQDRIRKAVGQQYKRELLNSYAQRVDLIMEILESELRLLREEVDRALSLEIQMICDIVVTPAPHSGRRRVMTQASEISDQLNVRKQELESVICRLDAISALLQSEGLGLPS